MDLKKTNRRFIWSRASPRFKDSYVTTINLSFKATFNVISSGGDIYQMSENNFENLGSIFASALNSQKNSQKLHGFEAKLITPISIWSSWTECKNLCNKVRVSIPII